MFRKSPKFITSGLCLVLFMTAGADAQIVNRSRAATTSSHTARPAPTQPVTDVRTTAMRPTYVAPAAPQAVAPTVTARAATVHTPAPRIAPTHNRAPSMARGAVAEPVAAHVAVMEAPRGDFERTLLEMVDLLERRIRGAEERISQLEHQNIIPIVEDINPGIDMEEDME